MLCYHYPFLYEISSVAEGRWWAHVLSLGRPRIASCLSEGSAKSAYLIHFILSTVSTYKKSFESIVDDTVFRHRPGRLHDT
jgi:hypothetical protein